MTDEFGYYAFVNDKNIVENVIVCNNRDDFQALMQFNPMGMTPGKWVPATEESGRPSKGNHYHPTYQRFYPQSRFKSWTFNEETWLWDPPVPKPKEEVDEEGQLVLQWLWDEPTLSWVELRTPNCIECEQQEEKIDQ